MKLKWQMGTVKFFDYWSGQGIVKCDNGSYHHIHYSAIKSDEKWKTLQPKQRVKFVSNTIIERNIIKKLEVL